MRVVLMSLFVVSFDAARSTTSNLDAVDDQPRLPRNRAIMIQTQVD